MGKIPVIKVMGIDDMEMVYKSISNIAQKNHIVTHIPTLPFMQVRLKVYTKINHDLSTHLAEINHLNLCQGHPNVITLLHTTVNLH